MTMMLVCWLRLCDCHERLEMSTLPTIVGVAVQTAFAVYWLPKPNRHHDVLQSVPGDIVDGEEGFLLDDGSFLGRRGAMQLAKDNGQFKRKRGKQYYQGSELFSEDLW